MLQKVHVILHLVPAGCACTSSSGTLSAAHAKPSTMPGWQVYSGQASKRIMRCTLHWLTKAAERT